jgi:hypothetical protein
MARPGCLKSSSYLLVRKSAPRRQVGDIGRSMRQLRLRHRQRIEAFTQQLDLTGLGYQATGEQLMERSTASR